MNILLCGGVLFLAIIANGLPIVPQVRNLAEDYRLPATVSVENYEIVLTLNDDVFETNTFTGTATIMLQPKETLQEIKLHSAVTISSFALKANGRSVTSTRNFNETTEILTISTNGRNLLPTELISLDFTYTGKLWTDEMYGFYRSSYEGTDGTPKYLATTQFQPTYARRAFPCFDEPSFKATFEITIIHPENYQAFGNTARQQSTSPTETVFEPTPVMSTYLVAFIVADRVDFTCDSGESIEPEGVIPYQVCSREAASTTRQVAVEFGPKLLNELEKFTGISYSTSGITKMDQVAIPDFAAGAMENWGLVTYRETALLWDEQESSNRYKQSVVTVIAHEFGHMWFGNLITTHWWSDTFLNEGFATYCGKLVTANVLPDWELEKQFVIEDVHSALSADDSETSRPLTYEANTPSQISSRFSTISYSKGGSIFRMVAHVLGEDNFQTGVNTYLTENQFSNTQPEDLWNALSTAITPTVNLPADTTLNQIMENWVVEAGFPLLTVSVSGNDVVISQKRYLASGAESDIKWYVPISYTVSTDVEKFQDTAPKAWLLPTEDLRIPNILANNNWIVINNQQTGYYRVNYDAELWNKIVDGTLRIDELNRAQIVDDLLNFAKVGIHQYARVFELISFLKWDVSYYSWYAAFNGFSSLLQRIGQEKIYDQISEYILTLMDDLYKSVPYSTTDVNEQVWTLKKVLAQSWACRLGHPECIANTIKDFQSYRETNERPNKNLRSIIYCNALRHSTTIKEDWDFLWSKFAETTIATEQVTILSSLGCAKDPTILQEYLRKSITESSGIRQQDALSVFSAVYSGNPEGVDIAFNFLLENHEEITTYYASMNSLASMINGLVSRFTSEEQVEKLRQFMNENVLTDSLQSSVETALIAAEANLKVTEEVEKQLEDFFEPSVPLEPAEPSYRLPQTINVENYEIVLTLNDDVFETNAFTGNAIIILQPKETLQEIQLHSAVTIRTFTLRANGRLVTTTTNFNETTDILTISTNGRNLLPTELIQLDFAYTGKLWIDEMYGFYRSSYEGTDGTPKYLATTQFQPTYARRAFPCFDEPSFKATFEITIIHPENYQAFGNTARQQSTSPTQTVFEPTPIMSTYLVAFIVADRVDFTCDSGESIEPEGVIPYQVCSREAASTTRQVAVEFGPKLLNELEKYTGISYSTSGITKMDQVAIPDFAAGAMENWGLVTYRETALLWDEQESSNSYKQRVVTVIAHEFGHMWFGNLITTHWWSDTFLNEGFATFCEKLITANVLPEWELEKQFVIEDVHTALRADDSETSRPLTYEANTPSQISSRFSTISYSKGGSILRMVAHVMGEDNFQKGVNTYLTENQFGNTQPGDLWTALSTAITPTANLPADTTLNQIMENWVVEAGFPLLTVSVSGNDVVISQKRYLASGAESDLKWYVPISYTVSTDVEKFQDTAPKAWLLPTENLRIPNILANNNWIVINNQQTGYYRVNYDAELWNKIVDGTLRIDELNRAQIVDDLLNFAKVGIHQYARVFELISFLKWDVSYYSWYAAFNGFSSLLQRIGQEKIYDQISEYILTLMDDLYKSVPYSTTDVNEQVWTLKKVLAQSWACRLGHPECIANSIKDFQSYRETNERPNKNLRSIIYCNALRHSTTIKEDWDFLWSKFAETTISTEQVTILSSLGCAKDSTILQEYLRKSITESSGIRQQDALSVFSAVYSGNPGGVDIAFNFLLENHEEITTYYASMNALASMLNGLVSRFTKEEQVEKLRQFMNENDLSDSLQSSVETALVAAEANIKITEEVERQLEDFFAPDTPGLSSTSTPSSNNATTTTNTPTDPPGGGSSSIHLAYTAMTATCILAILHIFN